MGLIFVDLELANNIDIEAAGRGDLPTEQVRRATIEGVVSTGVERLSLPVRTVAELGLQVTGQAEVQYYDGRREIRDLVGGVRLEYLGRSGLFDAVVEPGRTDALIGAVVLDELNLLADCGRGKLVPRDSVALPELGR